MPDWHGYPMHPDSVEGRPWWRHCVYSNDGAHLLVMRDFKEGSLMAEADHPDLPAAMVAYDTAHPLPPPPPRCGQVWLWPDSDRQHLVTDITTRGSGHTGITLGLEGPDCWLPHVPPELAPHSSQSPWPPPGAVLVAGPGAPWAPMGEPVEQPEGDE